MRNRNLVAVLLTLGLPAWARPGDARPSPTVAPNIPIDIKADAPTPEEDLPRFDDFSWREFIALTWSAKVDPDGLPRGLPDVSKEYGEVSSPRVWETWKADDELFLPQGGAPAGWKSFDTPSPCEPGLRRIPYDKYLASFDRYHGLNQAGPGTAIGPLVSQDREYIRYETRVNRTGFEFITRPPAPYRGPLYLRENLPGEKDPPLRFPTGSIQVKAAWRVMTNVPPEQRRRFYITRAHLLDPLTGRCGPAEVGLIGLHIVNKVRNFPDWVWSSFEHVDNVPALEGERSRARPPYSLHDGDPRTPPSRMDRPLGPCNPPRPHPAPTQVVRVRPIAASTWRTNQDYHEAPGVKGTVWENYQLVLTQWPLADEKGQGERTFPSTRAPRPQTNTANVALETWFQHSTDTSCMACHDTARQRGHDSVWFLPLGAFPQPSTACKG
ncbi:hypothetical protein [Archangium lipolyticum]|uniref:hypothetical protein n=1 Tax=Archangium lipolyticum TaxID=2970465 RepID=UPI002149A749|nr:hypothetical protein [Archangium lipolyticum]